MLLALLVVAGCSAVPKQAAEDKSYDAARDMFVTGYEDIASIYIDPVNLGDVAMAGLQRLSTIDPAISVKREASEIALSVDDRASTAFAVPADGDARDWGILTASALAAARSASPALRQKSSEDLYGAVFGGFVSKLDGFSRYSGAEAASENRATREGFGGIGVRIAVEDGKVRIVSVMHYTPAERLGLRADDIITHVDGVPVEGVDQQKIIALLRGPVDSRVKLTLLRATDGEQVSVAVMRAHIVPETVTFQREGDIAYLRLYSFNLDTADSLRKEVLNARHEMGRGLRGYVLDLRGNPGGLLDQAVAVADLFMEEGRIVSTHGRHPDSHQYFEATRGDITDGKPMAVLINGNSASASEIVAAALQDSGRAVVIGSNSYGKGTVQTVLRMPNDGELTLTWARFHAPSGYTLHHLGVLPSICTNHANENASKLLAELRANKLLPVPTTTRNAANPNDASALDRLRAACPVHRTEDPVDLQVAVKLLEEPSLYTRAVHLADPPQLTLSTDPALQKQP